MNNLAIVGATGLVGSSFLNLIKERNLSHQSLSLFASQKNHGKLVYFNKKQYCISSLKEGCFKGIDVAFFSAGGKISQEWIPQAVKEGCTVIDNSSVFRMQNDVPLVVPEINKESIKKSDKIIANPNCSTIQLCLVLHPLQKEFGLKRVHVATYQSLSGAGMKALETLKSETKSALEKSFNSNSHSFNYAFNCIPQIGDIKGDGFSVEDTKMQLETQKILNLPGLMISTFTVRVPTLVSHGEVLWVQLENKPQSRQALINALKKQRGLKVMDLPNQYPTNNTASHKDDVYVGRIHQDNQDSSTWLMWVCGDNLKKGAALNGIQIAEFLKTTSLG